MPRYSRRAFLPSTKLTADSATGTSSRPGRNLSGSIGVLAAGEARTDTVDYYGSPASPGQTDAAPERPKRRVEERIAWHAPPGGARLCNAFPHARPRGRVRDGRHAVTLSRCLSSAAA